MTAGPDFDDGIEARIVAPEAVNPIGSDCDIIDNHWNHRLGQSEKDSGPMDAASTLCTSCGLCCDGSLFSIAPLVPEDGSVVAPLQSYEDGGERYLSLPCPALNSERCCTVYGNRPQICSAFRCALLSRLDKRQITLQEATQKVAVARQHKLKTLAVVGQFVDTDGRGMRDIKQNYWNLSEEDQTRDIRSYKEGEFLLKVFGHYLKQYFIK
ncbi:MAG: YkgJ family cysteine cluster protein [Parasphingorhabdus sp.]